MNVAKEIRLLRLNSPVANLVNDDIDHTIFEWESNQSTLNK